MRSLVLAAAAALVYATGCAGPDGDAGANHVEELPLLVAERDMRIGDFDDPDLGFSRVSGMDVDHAGNIYVLEAQSSEIRVFSPEGTLLRTIGRQGGGPGEFQSPPRFGVLGDTVWAIDGRANRITLFDREGTVLSTGTPDDVAVPLPSGLGSVRPQMMRPDGTFGSHLSRVSFGSDEVPDVNPADRIPVPFVRFDPSGAVTDTLGWAGRPPPRMWRPPSEASAPPEFIERGGRRLAVPRPPTTLPWWLPLIDGYILVETPQARTADDARFTVTRIGLHEDTIYHRTLHHAPVPYSSEDLDSIAAKAARGEPGGGVPYMPGRPPPPDWEVIATHLRAAMEFPPFHLPVDYPWVDQDARVWLRETSEADAESVGWILLDSEGRPRGRLELPTRVRPMWSRGDTLWAVEPSDLDVPWVVRFSVRSEEG